MFPSLLAAVRAPLAALLVASALIAPAPLAFADDAKPSDKPGGQAPQKDRPTVEEYAEAQKEINGPAGNPECVRLGRRVVALLKNDDLDTAFRHLDLYDRFGCPGAHIQASFRCILLHSDNIDTKVEGIEDRIAACWLNPTNPAPPPAAAAAAPAAPATNAPAKN